MRGRWLLVVLVLETVVSIPMMTPLDPSGDPAPGRSPGPPARGEEGGLNDETATVNESQWCSPPMSTLASPFYIVVSHPKFSLNAGIVSGVYYTVAILSNNEEVSEEAFVISSTGEWSEAAPLHKCPWGTGVVKDLTSILSLSWTVLQPPSEISNVTFRAKIRSSSGSYYGATASYLYNKDCKIEMSARVGTLSSADLPRSQRCRIAFPTDSQEEDPAKRRGLLLQLTRLNIPCIYGGFLEVSGTGDQRARRLCGKLEELSSSDRAIHLPASPQTPSLLLSQKPIFSLNYTLVDYCYNVTLTSQNGSTVLSPSEPLLCNYHIHLPYGNRIRLLLQVGEEPTTTALSSEVTEMRSSSSCDGLLVIVWNGESEWTHCSGQATLKPNVEVESVANAVEIRVVAGRAARYPPLRFWYSAVPVPDVVGPCLFGEVSVHRYCASVVRQSLPWSLAEEHCVANGGHLLSIRDQHAQFIVDNLLLKSPGAPEQDSFWIGASDISYEGHYQWSDGHAFSYSNWFPGWQEHGFNNRQPNDDGFSGQDCVEVRRKFPAPSGYAPTTASSYLWNDLDCSTPNHFLCERLQSEDMIEDSWRSDCNRTVSLTREHSRIVATSPGFPNHYPDNVRCTTRILAPPGHHIILDFDEMVLEKEPMCSYDYLEIVELSGNNSVVNKRTTYCGDMSDRLKLLRYVSQTSQLVLVFASDYSHHFDGFKARVSIENARKDCSDDKYKKFGNFCYLFVGYPKVTWETAQQICSGMKAQLASVESVEEHSFITGHLRSSVDYSISAMYWLGGYFGPSELWVWTDGTPLQYSAWAPNDGIDNSVAIEPVPQCLGLKWVSAQPGSDGSRSSSGLYWASGDCANTGGYVCKKAIAGTGLELSKTINGSEGVLTSPGHPSNYRPDLDYEVHLVGPAWTRIVVTVSKLDMESQPDCLYDYLELKSGRAAEPEVRWCGSWNTKIHPFNFVSSDNEAYIRFHSDYSVSGTGFASAWKAVDISGCPSQTHTAREGILSSPNYPYFLLPKMDCTTTILAAAGKRVWIEFSEVSIGDPNETDVELTLGDGLRPIRPFISNNSLGGSSFVSVGEKMVVRLITSSRPSGEGFRAIYRSVSAIHEERIVDLSSDSVGVVLHLNYPSQPPRFVDFMQHFVAPLGFTVSLEFHNVILSEQGPMCPSGRGIIEVNDNYADLNGTWWFLCPVDAMDVENSLTMSSPVAITSYLHTLHVRQRSSSVGLYLNATLRVREDPQFKVKLLRVPEDSSVESCRPNPCLNGGRCIHSSVRKTCQCTSHFTGIFCALTQCDLDPCLFGSCELTPSGYHCSCHPGYTGYACEQKQRPCAENPCEGRGECIERGEGFHCQCHAWWEGPRCERKMVHIPYKPLSERMLQEPFWLGLITVFVVLGVIGLFWCAKRHFPEKLEKLLAEEADRRTRSHASVSGRPSSGRDPGGSGGGGHSPQSTCPRTLFGRLGIRKPSLLSLASPGPCNTAAPRTFSLDDLLRNSPRRSPSPRKKRTNSTPTKKNATEKKQILHQLISPSNSQAPPTKVSLNELMQLKEKNPTVPKTTKELQVKETSFSLQVPPPPLSDDKLEKKVTFARLLNKVSAEMSSGSEVESSKLSLGRALSTPSSPAEIRMSSIGHCNDSLSSSEVTISGAASNLDIPMLRPGRLGGNVNRYGSDSLLAMFRNVSPQAPSPSQDSFCSEDSLAVDTTLSSPSAQSESNSICSGFTFEVPVLDPLAAQKSAHSSLLQPPSIHLELPSAGISKFLSPIHEVPTPMSSPALTPIMTRTEHESKRQNDSSEDDSNEMGNETDDFTEESTELVVEIHQVDDQPFPYPVIPIVTIEQPSPKKEQSSIPTFVFTGSPPPQKREEFRNSAPKSPPRKLLKEIEKPMSLDLPHPPPMITVTCNASEGESDPESGKQLKPHNPTVNSAGMSYLSPFSMCSRGDRTASESNLSSSGYSSMASPGPSRCGSNNPLCLSEVEDQGALSQPPSRRPSPLLRTPPAECNERLRRRSDSETLSDDQLMESNDEGIGTDQLDEKLEDIELKTKECINLYEFGAVTPIPPPRGVFKKCDISDTLNSTQLKSSLQLPTIVVQSDFCDKMLSPVSSRSESPLSDKTLGLGRFSPMFYCKNKNEQLPFTDSDGLYDFPSSDCPPSKHKSVQACTAPHRKRRDRRSSMRNATAGSKSPSPTKGLASVLDLPKKDPPTRSPRKPSPKRRSRTHAPPSSSSSTESLTFGKGGVSIRLTAPDGTEWPVKDAKTTMSPAAASNEASAEDTAEEVSDAMGSDKEELPRTKRNLNRLRSIGNQIRFLRRIELSLRRKARLVSVSDSGEDDEEDQSKSCRAALLPTAQRATIQPAAREIRKSGSNGVLFSGSRSKQRCGSPLLPVSVGSHGQTD